MNHHHPFVRGVLAACLSSSIGACACDPSPIPPSDAGVPTSDASTVDPEICEGLDPQRCLLPWPSSRFIEADGHVAISEEALEQGTRNVVHDPSPWNGWDGFSASTSMVVRFPGEIDASALSAWQSAEPGLGASSPTIVLDTTNGTRIAHFVDVQPPSTAERSTTLIIRPAERLPEGAHIVVGIRTLRDPAGVAIAPYPAFDALRESGSDANHPRFEDDVLAPLEAAGAPREDLLLAWDFRTASGDFARSDLLEMLEHLATPGLIEGLGCEVDVPIEHPLPDEARPVFREVQGRFTVPQFLDPSADHPTLRRASDGSIAPPSGTIEATFVAAIPESVMNGDPTEQVALVLHGHGFRTARWEVVENWSVDTLDRARMIGIATDLRGLYMDGDHDDLAFVLSSIATPDDFPRLIDRVLQSLIAMIVLPRVFASVCAVDPDLNIADRLSGDVHYTGHSQGAIIGPTIAAVMPEIERFALGVGGMEYPVMLPRASGWRDLRSGIRAVLRGRVEEELLLVMLANHWDRFEGAGFAPHVDASLVGTPREPHILYQVGLHDTDTPSVGSEIAGRTLALPVLSASAHEPWGLEVVDAPVPSAYVVYDEDQPAPSPAYEPGECNDVHQRVRRDERAQRQIAEHLRTGQVIDTCDGGCGPSGASSFDGGC